MELGSAHVHGECPHPCRREISPQRLLSILIGEFGGEAICADLASRMQVLPSFKAVDARCIVCIRGMLDDLCRLELVTLEAMEEGKLLARVTSKGVA